MNDRLLIRVIVDRASEDITHNGDVAEYVFDLNDDRQRRIFAEQMTNAYLAGQVVTTYAEEWSEGRPLRAIIKRPWLRDPLEPRE